MKVLRVFPERTSYTPTDDMVWIGYPGLWRPEADEVHISVAFTWHLAIAEKLRVAWSAFYPTVRVGGPAFGKPSGEFTSGMYVRPGITFTSRGCIRRCDKCFVPEREGRIREYEPFAAAPWVCDDNLLACSRNHVERVFEMLRSQKHIEFPGGIDARLLQPWHVEAMRGLRIDQLFLAYDYAEQREPCERAITMLREAGFDQRQVRVYMLAAFEGDTPEAAEGRLKDVFNMGALPYMMRYQDDDGNKRGGDEWGGLSWTWQRPAGVFAAMAAERGQGEGYTWCQVSRVLGTLSSRPR